VKIRGCPAAVSGNESRQSSTGLIKTGKRRPVGKRCRAHESEDLPTTAACPSREREGRSGSVPKMRTALLLPSLEIPRSTQYRTRNRCSNCIMQIGCRKFEKKTSRRRCLADFDGNGIFLSKSARENREGGERPPRPRHCDRLAAPRNGGVSLPCGTAVAAVPDHWFHGIGKVWRKVPEVRRPACDRRVMSSFGIPRSPRDVATERNSDMNSQTPSRER